MCGTVLTANMAQLHLDFGTADGKVSLAESNFEVGVPISGQYKLIEDAVRMTHGEQDGFFNSSFLRNYRGLGESYTYDFVISLKSRIHKLEGTSNRRWGIHLFATGIADTRFNGISAQVIGNKRGRDRYIALRYGLDGQFLAKAVLGPGDVKPGQEYTFTVTGTFEGEKDLNLSLTVTDGNNTQTTSATVDRSHCQNTKFGGSARLRTGWVIDFYNFTVTLP